MNYDSGTRITDTKHNDKCQITHNQHGQRARNTPHENGKGALSANVYFFGNHSWATGAAANPVLG